MVRCSAWPHEGRTVLVDTPVTSFPWSLEVINDTRGSSGGGTGSGSRGGGTGISGTHSALASIARRFAAEGWWTLLSGSLRGRSTVANLCYLPPFPPKWLAQRAAATTFDLIVSTNVDEKRVMRPNARLPWFWQRLASTRSLLLIMENQHISGPSCFRLGDYLARQWMSGHGTRLVFVHLSEWGAEAHRQNALGRLVTASSGRRFSKLSRAHVRSMSQCMAGACPFTLERWVAHETSLFANPVDVGLFDAAAVRARPRNRRSLIFPACQERGGLVAARVFTALRREWGEAARATFAFYDKATAGSAELARIKRELGVPSTDDARDARGVSQRAVSQRAQRTTPQVAIGTMSKAELAVAMHEVGFFVYGLVSSGGTVHYDTFASVVAECLAAGVIVLAPRVAALPYLYDGLIVFVDPPRGYSRAMRQTTLLAADDSGLGSDAMVDRYASEIRAILANATRDAELRARGMQSARRRFSEASVTRRLFRYVEDELVGTHVNSSATQLLRRRLASPRPAQRGSDAGRRGGAHASSRTAVPNLAVAAQRPGPQSARYYFPGDPRPDACAGAAW